MQLTIQSVIPAPDVARIEDALTDADPSALVDFDAAHGTLRLSTILEPTDVASVLASVGVHVEPGRISRVPSECCGGCGG